MADIEFKNGTNIDTAYIDGHKVRLIAIPNGTLQLPISATSDSGYIIDGNGKKHRVLLAAFLTGTPEYKESQTEDTAYITVDGQKHKVTLTAQLSESLQLSNLPNVNQGYATGSDSKKHRVTLIATPEGTLELPDSQTYDYAYVVDNNGKKHKVKLLVNIGNGYTEVVIRGTSPLYLENAVEDGLIYLKAFGGTEQRNLPEGYKELEYILSTGTGNVINTGITGFGNGDYKFEVKWRLTAEPVNNYGSVFTIYTDESTNAYRIICNQKSTTTYLVNGNSIASSGSIGVYNVAANVDHIGIAASGKVTIDGTDYNTPTQGTDIPSTTQLRITSTGFNGRIYYFKVYKNDVLVYNFVPCQTPSNHIGLYDTINNVFYEAATNHTPGPEVSTLTPTPTEPVDIWCNNGALRFSNKSGLPLSYTELEYIYCDGNSYILTDILTSNTIGYKSRFKIVNRETLLFGARRTATADGFCFGYVVTNGRVYTSYGADTTGRTITVNLVDNNWHTVILDDTQYLIDGEIQSFTFKGTASDFYAIALGSWNQAGTVDPRCFDGYISNFEVYDTATSSTLGKFIPAKRNSDNVIGFYDTISGTFYTNDGSGTFTGGPEILPELYADGDIETITTNAGGSVLSTATCENLLAIAGTKDVQEILSGDITRAIGVKVLDGSENWASTTVAGITYYMADILDDNMFSHLICTHFVNNAPMLADNTIYKSAGSSVLQIRYDGAADLAAFKSWLTDQYTAGTPVIVLYGLETPTTESVAGQSMTVVEGDNTAEITQASIDGLEIEAKYQKNL